MQNCSNTLYNKIDDITRYLGFTFIIDGISTIFALTYSLIKLSQPFQYPILFGQGYKFGQTHPQESRTIVFGDYITEYPYSNIIFNIIDISDILFETNIEDRISNIATLEIQLYNNQYTQQLLTEDIKGRYAELIYGINYSMTPEGRNYIPIFRGIIKEVNLSDDATIITIRVEHWFSFAKDEIFARPISALSSDITNSQTSITLDSTEDFPQNGYIKIDEEMIYYNGITGNQLVNCSRGLYTNAAEHKKSTKVEYCKIYSAGITLPIFLLQVLTSTGTGANGIYDVLPAGCGLGIPVDYIDTDSFINFENIGITYYNQIYPSFPANQSQLFDLFFYESYSTKKLLSSILNILNAYLIIDNDCYIKLIPDKPDGIYPLWSNNDIISYISSENTYINNSYILKVFSTKFNIWQTTDMHFTNQQSVSKYGKKEKTLDFILWTPFISNYGKPGQEPDPLEEEIDERHLYLSYALHYNLLQSKEPRKIYSTKTTFRKVLYELGDKVSFTKNNETKNCYIISRNISIKNAQIEFKMLEIL